MKTIKTKKTGLFVAMLALFVLALSLISGIYSHHALAITAPPTGGGNGDSFVYQDRANIIATFSSGNQVTFTDVNPLDSNRNYVPLQGEFCKPSSGQFGITVPSKADLTAPTITGQLTIGNTVGNNCNAQTQTISIQNPQTPVPVAAATFEWDTNNIVTFPNETARNQTFTQTTTTSGSLYFSDQSAGNCPENGAILLTSGNNHALYYALSSISFSVRGYIPPQNLSSYKQLNQTGAVDGTKCHVDSVLNITISGTAGQPAQNGGGGTSSGGSNTVGGSGTCEANGWALDWFACPVLEAADSFSKASISLFEKQLGFRVSDLNRNNGGDRTRLSWSLIRDISSALMVILMLVMVISQATGGGPFEAYTIRKMLPRLVIAVILIQLSWTLLSYFVNIFDDIGHGLKEILYLPFQPANLDDYGILLKNAGIGTWQAGAFSWAALIGIGIGVAVALPAILGFAFAAIMADLVGLSTLIFRKIIIIMALILSPIAILLWVLPGTQRYFKLWWDNLLKALMMFPLVIGIVAAGRIFAYVIGTTGNGTFLNFFLVTVAFFAPLFILPKTFKWGGEAMKVIGDTAMKGADRYLIGKESRPMKYFGNRQQDWSEARRAESQRRYGLQTPFNPRRFWQYPLDRLRAGQWDPLLGRAAWMNVDGHGITTDARMRKRKMTGYKEAGLKHEEEDQSAANREVVLNEKRLDETGYANGGYNHDHYHQDNLRGSLDWYNARIHDRGDGQLESYADRDEREWVREHGSLEGFQPGYRDYEGRIMPVDEHKDEFETNAILNRIGELGADTNHQEIIRYIKQEMRSGDPGRIRHIQRWMQDNKELILKNYPHLLKGRGSALDANEIFGVHGAGGADIIADTTSAIDSSTGEDQRREQARLRKYVKTAIENMRSTRRESIEQGYRRVMKALATGDQNAHDAILEVNPDTGDLGVNATRSQRIIGTDPATGDEISLTPIRGVLDSPAVRAALSASFDPNDPTDYAEVLDSMLDASGSYTSGGGGSARVPRTSPVPPVTGRPGSERGSLPPDESTDFGGVRYASGPLSTPPSASPPVSAREVRPTAATAPTATATPATPSFGSSGSFEPSIQTQTNQTTERIIRETSPTIISPTNTTIIQQQPTDGSQVVYSRTPETTPTTARAIDPNTAEELNYQLRNVYRELKKMGARSQQQQKQFEQLRNQHPDWDNEDDNN